MRQMQQRHENPGKRQVKAPKVYVHDTSLLHALLDVRTAGHLDLQAGFGASADVKRFTQPCTCRDVVSRRTSRMDASRQESAAR
jgi:hypothetical protein